MIFKAGGLLCWDSSEVDYCLAWHSLSNSDQHLSVRLFRKQPCLKWSQENIFPNHMKVTLSAAVFWLIKSVAFHCSYPKLHVCGPSKELKFNFLLQSYFASKCHNYFLPNLIFVKIMEFAFWLVNLLRLRKQGEKWVSNPQHGRSRWH